MAANHQLFVPHRAAEGWGVTLPISLALGVSMYNEVRMRIQWFKSIEDNAAGELGKRVVTMHLMKVVHKLWFTTFLYVFSCIVDGMRSHL